MQNEKQIRISPKMQKITDNIYLLLVALYFLLATAQLINILVNLTVGSDAGIFFEFINTPTDRIIVYALNFVTTFYITVKLRKATACFLSFCVLSSWLLHLYANSRHAHNTNQFRCSGMVSNQP